MAKYQRCVPAFYRQSTRHAPMRPLGPYTCLLYGSVCPMCLKTAEAPMRGLRNIGWAPVQENGAIHYSPVTSMKSVWASPRWKISFSSTA